MMVGWVKKEEKMRLGREEGQKEKNSTFKGPFLGSELDIKVGVRLGYRLGFRWLFGIVRVRVRAGYSTVGGQPGLARAAWKPRCLGDSSCPCSGSR